MSGIKDSHNVDEVRKRLYERGKSPVPTPREELAPKPSTLPRSFDVEPVATLGDSEPVGTQTPPLTIVEEPKIFDNEVRMSSTKRKRTYRLKILLAGVVFFVGALVVSSFLLLFGNQNISGENIALAVTGPFTVGGGEILPLQVGITNSNSVPIQAATLIVNYPPGTKAANEAGNDLFTERLSLETIGSGETINVPVRAVVFGEENEEKTVEVSIEYRVQGSNATFFKEAEPLRFKISSSPLVVSADNLKKVSSGQETEVTLTITSNAPNPLPEVLVKAEYPLGFDFTSATPGPSGGQNTWFITDLQPESSQTIKIKGVIVGKETDEYAINFTVGVPNDRDRQNLASVLSSAQTFFEIEQPFLDVSLATNGDTATEVAIDPEQRTEVEVKIENTLDSTIYDAQIKVTLGGNAFSVFNVYPVDGYYDSTAKTITWDVANTPDLESLEPGESKTYQFTIEPRGDVGRTPQLTVKADVEARRVSEDSATEMLTGTANTTVKVATAPTIEGEAGYNNGIFTDRGPVPPRVGVETTYTMSLMMQNGSNDVTDAVVSTTLPQYVEWTDQTAGAGSFSYNPTTRVVDWNIGSLEAGAASFASFQLSFEPRVTQAGQRPVLMGEQRVKATDRFTGTVVRATNPAVTTQLSSEAGFDANSGVVQN
jgi:hypothetical protein